MGRISDPMTFAAHFGVPEGTLDQLGVLNPTLNADTKLFIDPFLIPKSAHHEIAVGARGTYTTHFEQVIALLGASQQTGDVAWRNAKRLMRFPEIKATCLGYGASSVSGSGSGAFTTNAVLQTAKAIVDLGIRDPDLFVAMGVFEEGIGPDRISDMTTNVILPDLIAFNERILEELDVPTQPVEIILKNGNAYDAVLPLNPYESTNTPVILVPADILRDLPIAKDWSDVADAAAKNAALRTRVNRQIANIWRRRTLRDKAELRSWATSSQEAFETFLDLLKSSNPKPYDFAGDPLGELFWRRVADHLAAQQPFELQNPERPDADGVADVVRKIIEQFQFLIEQRRFSEELYHQGQPRPEKAAQRLFFAVAHAYCKANNLDVTPEADTGNGPVDFKMSSGFTGRVLVELKLSRNPKVVAGYTRQLKAYKEAEETTRGFYVVIDVGGMGKKDEQLIEAQNRERGSGRRISEIVFIDGSRRASASKL